ncbi:hypothetical protein AUI06_09045 [archaeon 13_2_20CM_2_52_21]|nr:MAG: hypothetical protein AUI06_09045 [archaeon 13_2_20CM_2_52_21]
MAQQPQNPLFNYPGYQLADIFYEELHEDMLMILSLQLVMPSVAGKYIVPVFVWEKRLGKSKYELIFDIQ